jgi:hypothetical protein
MTFAIIQNMFIPSLGDTMPTLALIAVIAGVVFIIYGEIKVRGSLKNS